MKFSAVAALCAAPLALAGTLQHDLAARGVAGVELELSARGEGSKPNNEKGPKNNNENGNGKYGNNVVLVQQSQTTEVIIIWVNNGGGAATQTVTDTVTVTQNGGSGTAAAAAATHSVTVGGSAGLVYSPESVVAAVGDMVIFTFLSNNHTATQSGFAEPCKKLPEGMDSGFLANVNNTVSPPPQMAVQVTVDTPIWFYCRQKGHCGKGMVFSINPTADKTQAMFKQMAIAQNGTGAASPITGGTASVAPPPPASTESAAAAPPPPATESAAPPPAATESAAATVVTSAAAAAGTGLVGGSGNLSGGSCQCACLCGTAAFPNVDLQGLGAFGGLPGAMPMASLTA